MSSSFSDSDFLQITTKVNNWFLLGIHLKIPYQELQIIYVDRRCSREFELFKVELFHAWMRIHPNDSWIDLVQALEKCNENATADRIRRWHLQRLPADTSLQNAQQPQKVEFKKPLLKVDGRGPSRLQALERPLFLITCTSFLFSVTGVIFYLLSWQFATTMQCDVAKFSKLELSYVELTLDLKTSLEEKVPILSLERFLIDLLDLHLQDRKTMLQATTIDNVFELISPYYCFLNTAVLGDIIDKFIGEPVKYQLEEYERQLEDFKESTSMYFLQKYRPQWSPNILAPKVIIKLSNCYRLATVKRFQRLAEQIFKENFTVLANIKVEVGSLHVTWLTRKSMIPSLIDTAKELKKDVMQLVGVLRVSVADVEILEEKEEEDGFLSSALVRAIYAECIEAVEILLEILEADPNSPSESGDVTPLMVASYLGNIKIAKLLLRFHAKVDQQLANGWTALMNACDSETPHYGLVQLLVESGADISIKNKEQKTALMIAVERGHTSIAQYLLHLVTSMNVQAATAPDSFTWNAMHTLVTKLVKNEVTAKDLTAAEETMRGLTFDKFSETWVCKVLPGIETVAFKSVIEKFANKYELPDEIKDDILDGEYTLENGESVTDFKFSMHRSKDADTFMYGRVATIKRPNGVIDVAYSVYRLVFELSPIVIAHEKKNIFLGFTIGEFKVWRESLERNLSVKERDVMRTYFLNKAINGFRKKYSGLIEADSKTCAKTENCLLK